MNITIQIHLKQPIVAAEIALAQGLLDHRRDRPIDTSIVLTDDVGFANEACEANDIVLLAILGSEDGISKGVIVVNPSYQAILDGIKEALRARNLLTV